MHFRRDASGRIPSRISLALFSSLSPSLYRLNYDTIALSSSVNESSLHSSCDLFLAHGQRTQGGRNHKPSLPPSRTRVYEESQAQSFPLPLFLSRTSLRFSNDRGQVLLRPCRTDRMLPGFLRVQSGPRIRVVGCTGMHAVGWPGAFLRRCRVSYSPCPKRESKKRERKGDERRQPGEKERVRKNERRSRRRKE